MITKHLQTSRALEMLISTIEKSSLHKYIVWLEDDADDMRWPEIKAFLLDVDREERRALIEDTQLEADSCRCPEWKKEIMLKELGELCCSKKNIKS